MPAVLRERLACPIAKVGQWATATGEWVCTAEQLRDAVLAQHDPVFRAPVLKCGHTDSRFTDGQLLGDGQPAVGRLQNLRTTPDGQTLLADLVGIPAWLDDILESAYPSRSIECMTGVETAQGARYAMVVTGLALLGESPPAIETLGDIAALYGVPTSVDAYTATAQIAAALPMGDTMPAAGTPPTGDPGTIDVRRLGQIVTASASIDELCCAAEEWAEDQPMLGGEVWVRDIYTDTVILTQWLPGGESRMWRIPWTEADGKFAFGTPEQVRPSYEPVPAEGAVQASAAPGVPDISRAMPIVARDAIRSRTLRGGHGTVLSGRGWGAVSAGEHPQEQSVPISPALAAELGVPEDADDATVIEAITRLRTPVVPEPPTTPEGEGETVTTPTPTPTPQADIPAVPAVDVAQLVSAAVDARIADAIKRANAPVLASLTETSTELAAMKAERAQATKDRVIGDAVTAGRITPASKASWEGRYDQAPDVITDVLASLADGSAVPVTAAGHAGGEVTSLSDEEEALWKQLYPELAGGEH